MTGRWSKNKTKKPLETSLGQAPKDADKAPDLSHLRKPITTSIFGLKQVLSLFQTATNEVQDYITYECDVLYECRICRTIFRSLANFILHKRNYCREKCNSLGGVNPESSGGFVVGDAAAKAAEEEVSEKIVDSNKSQELVGENSRKNDAKKAILPIIDKLVKRQEVNILAKTTLNEDLSNKAENSDDDVVFVSEESNVVLQQIDTSNAAVFQTSVNDEQMLKRNSGFMKSEVMEIHGIFDNNEAVLGCNGKVCNFETNKKIFKPNIPKQDLVCTECKFTFSTEKTLTHHIKYKHNKTCIVYPCPDCKETFANAWSVYRHLYKVHRRTSSQVRRMRAQIHSSGIRKDQEPEKKKDKTQTEPKESEENQWMNNFEGDKDLQMCGGCGKRFERKAALHSHSQMCTKRIAVCNTIKENNLKTKSAENKGKLTEKGEKANGVKVVKGSARRKPNFMFVHKVLSNVEEINPVNGVEGDKDVKTSFDSSNKSSPSEDTNKESPRGGIDTNIKTNDEKRKSRKGAILAKYLHQVSLEKVSEIISDSDDEKENSIAIPTEEPIIKNNLDGDVTITKYQDTPAEDKPEVALPEIEIFTISDDSCESNATQKNTTVKIVTKLESTETPKISDDPGKSLKRKRAASLDCDTKTMKVTDEYKEYLNDELDQCFFAKVVPYIDKDELKCVPCQTTYLSQYQLLWHMSLHFSWFRFQCSKCSFMSFNKYDCTTHAYVQHGTPNNLMGSTVLPIPKWKVLLAAHNFAELSEEDVKNNAIEQCSNVDEGNKTMPCLEAIQENSDISESSGGEANEKSSVAQNGVPEETIVLEDDEMPDICHETASETVILSDDEAREQLANATKEGKSDEKAGPSRAREGASNRPIRNRTKSVKTVQNDFIYDLAKVLKLNDNSIKSSRLKKNLTKSLKE